MGLTGYSGSMAQPPLALLAMPFYPHADPVDFRAALEWAAARPGLPELGKVESDGTVATVDIPGGYVALARMPGPIPAGDVQPPVEAAWHWPGAREAVAQHRSHIVCHANSSRLDALTLHVLHSRIVAGLVVAGGGTGIWVGSSALVREGPEYVRDMEVFQADSLPLVSWIGFNPVGEDGRLTAAYTTGLASFGLLELEVRDATLGWGEVFPLLANVAHYQVSRGVQIGDGETLGVSATERRLVRHLDSTYFPGTRSAVIAA